MCQKTTQYLHQKKAWHFTVQEVKNIKSFVSSTHLSTVGVFFTFMSQKTKTNYNTTGPSTIDSTATYKGAIHILYRVLKAGIEYPIHKSQLRILLCSVHRNSFLQDAYALCMNTTIIQKTF